MSIYRVPIYIFEIYYGHTLTLCSWILFVKLLLAHLSFSLPVECSGFHIARFVPQVADLRGRGQGEPGQRGGVDVRPTVLQGGRQAGERADEL